MASVITFPHFSAGPTLVNWDSVNLGYCEDRVEIAIQPRYENVMNDGFGGMAGIPSDVQFLGATATITATLNRFAATGNDADMDVIITDLAEFTAAEPSAPKEMAEIGSFVVQDDLYGILVLTATNETLTFPVTFIRQAMTFNSSVRHRRVGLVFEALIEDPCYMNLLTRAAGTDPCTGLS